MALKTNILLETGTNELEIVEFGLKYKNKFGNIFSQSYGINVSKVREIIRLPNITEIPNLPESIVGVCELRKKIIPVIDLCSYLYNINNVSLPQISQTAVILIWEFSLTSSILTEISSFIFSIL